ncbi:MAG: biotin/lipoyl-containing protein [bacterium]
MPNDTVYVRLDNHEYEVAFEKDRILVNGFPVPVELLPASHKALVRARIGNQIVDFPMDFTDEGARILFAGHDYVVQFEDYRRRMLRSLGAAGEQRRAAVSVKAPMPGLVVKIEAKVGQNVTKGQGVIVVEAMKMENEVRAPDSGVVKEIRVKERQTVEKGEVLVVIE